MPSKNKIILCKECGKEKIHCAKGLCYTCYKRIGTPRVVCIICKKQRPHKAKGMCGPCYMKTLYYDKIKESNIKRYHNISLAEWKAITKMCIICEFDKIVELHHLGRDKKNNQIDNLIGLCPNHHKMLHNEKYGDEVTKEILKKLNKRQNTLT